MNYVNFFEYEKESHKGFLRHQNLKNLFTYIIKMSNRNHVYISLLISYDFVPILVAKILNQKHKHLEFDTKSQVTFICDATT